MPSQYRQGPRTRSNYYMLTRNVYTCRAAKCVMLGAEHPEGVCVFHFIIFITEGFRFYCKIWKLSEMFNIYYRKKLDNLDTEWLQWQISQRFSSQSGHHFTAGDFLYLASQMSQMSDIVLDAMLSLKVCLKYNLDGSETSIQWTTSHMNIKHISSNKTYTASTLFKEETL